MDGFRDAWGLLTPLDRIMTVAIVLGTVGTTYLALFHPGGASTTQVITVALAIVLCWAMALALLRESVASTRLSDPEYFHERYE